MDRVLDELFQILFVKMIWYPWKNLKKTCYSSGIFSLFLIEPEIMWNFRFFLILNNPPVHFNFVFVETLENPSFYTPWRCLSSKNRPISDTTTFDTTTNLCIIFLYFILFALLLLQKPWKEQNQIPWWRNLQRFSKPSRAVSYYKKEFYYWK